MFPDGRHGREVGLCSPILRSILLSSRDSPRSMLPFSTRKAGLSGSRVQRQPSPMSGIRCNHVRTLHRSRRTDLFSSRTPIRCNGR
jgi:hypothetical protein